MSPVPSDKPSNKPLKVLIAADTYPPDVNGAAVFCYRLATAMHARGHDVHVVAARNCAGPSTVEVREEATIHRIASHAVPTHQSYRICFPWRAGPDLGRILDEVRPDVVHVQCHYMIGHAAVNQAKKRGIRIVATNHFMPENLDPFLPFPQWFKKIVAKNSWRDMGRIMGRADVVTTPTPLAAAAMRERAGLQEVLALSNGIDSAHYELAEGEEVQRREHPTVLFVGRLAVEKNIDVLIDAVAATRAGAHLEVIGGGEQLEPLQQKARAAGIADRVHFRGHVDDEALREAYLAADVFCQPGTAELQSLVTLEALSASRPVVLANAMALPHLVDDGVNGYLFEPGDSTGLAAKLDAILDLDEAGRRAMGEAGHAKAVKHSQEKTMSTFEAIYRGADFAEVAP
ncbi:hypothetical protein GCM10027591_08290 [Zhihengliuella somnathii]